MKISLAALVLLVLPASAAEKVCALVDATSYDRDQFGDVDRAKFRVARETWCVRVADDRKTAGASVELEGEPRPFVYADLTWNTKSKRWERWIPDPPGRYFVSIEDKGDHYRVIRNEKSAIGAMTVVDIPKPR
jgi:hypothetical protein